MLGKQKFKISEAVSAGHPDKIADQISDLILDWCLAYNPLAKVAIETMVTSNNIIISGEVNEIEINQIEIEDKIRRFLKKLGYNKDDFNYETIKFTFLIKNQSKEILNSVQDIYGQGCGAGDQGVVFGYAIDETEDLMPAPIYYSNKILKQILTKYSKNLGPDGKIQIVIGYDDNGKPVKVEQILMSLQHTQETSYLVMKYEIFHYLLKYLATYNLEMCHYDDFLFNPSGSFVIGGPASDCGVTGRKIIVDSYGCGVPHGGGAFSGKDATKIDRSAAYMARYLAKNFVAKKITKECLIKIGYAIGIYAPLLLHVYIAEKGKLVRDNYLENYCQKTFDLSPFGISRTLNLSLPIFFDTASYGHFGREFNDDDKTFSWEGIHLKKF